MSRTKNNIRFFELIIAMDGKVSVIGFGAMGSGIAEYIAIHNYEVNVYEISRDIFDANMSRVADSLTKLHSKGRISVNTSEVTSRITFLDSIEKCVSGSDIVIEAVNEDATLKSEIARKASSSVGRDAIITTNTSSIPISYIQGGVSWPERFAGLHWFNPPVLMDLIEIVKGNDTSEETVLGLSKFVKGIGKEQIVARKDVRGFIANRIFRALRYHALILYSRGLMDAKQIDSALIYKLGLPMGALALTDFTGGMKIESDEWQLYDEIRMSLPQYEPSKGYDSMYRAVAKITSKYVNENRLGMRSGRGIYNYPEPGRWKMPDICEKDGENVSLIDLLAPMYNHGLYMVKNGICTESDIDKSLKLGFRWPKGLFEVFNEEYSKKDIKETLEKFSEKFPDLSEFYRYEGD